LLDVNVTAGRGETAKREACGLLVTRVIAPRNRVRRTVKFVDWSAFLNGFVNAGDDCRTICISKKLPRLNNAVASINSIAIVAENKENTKLSVAILSCSSEDTVFRVKLNDVIKSKLFVINPAHVTPPNRLVALRPNIARVTTEVVGAITALTTVAGLTAPATVVGSTSCWVK